MFTAKKLRGHDCIYAIAPSTGTGMTRLSQKRHERPHKSDPHPQNAIYSQIPWDPETIFDRPSLNHPAKGFLIPVFGCRIAYAPFGRSKMTRKRLRHHYRRAFKFVQLSLDNPNFCVKRSKVESLKVRWLAGYNSTTRRYRLSRRSSCPVVDTSWGFQVNLDGCKPNSIGERVSARLGGMGDILHVYPGLHAT